MKYISLWCVLCWFVSPLAWAGPDIEHWKTESGLRVYYVSAPDLPMLDLRLTFAAGSSRDADKPGLAMLTNSMLNEGAGGLNADQLAESFESVGAVFGSGSARDMGWVSLRTLTLENQLNVALDTWLNVLGHADFPEKEFANIKKLTLVGLDAEKQSPEALGSKAWFAEVYGDHPYASPQNGTVDTISAMTIDDLKGFYQQFYAVQNGVLAMVGAIDRTQAEALAERIAKVLPQGERAPPLPAVKPLTEARTIHIPYPSEQSHITMGLASMKRDDADFFALTVGNHILGGGGFTSRLVEEIRNQRGLSYSVYSYFSSMAAEGPFLIGLQTRLDQTDEALTVVHETLDKFLADGPSNNELGAAIKNITGGFPLRTASNGSIMGYLSSIGFYDLPLDYLETYTAKVEKLTQEAIVDAFKRRVDPEKMLTVIVGGAEDKETSEQKKTSE